MNLTENRQHRAVMLVSPELIALMASGHFETVKSAAPSDAKVVAAGYDDKRYCFCIVLESPLLPAVEPGGEYPKLDPPLIRKYTPDHVSMHA